VTASVSLSSPAITGGTIAIGSGNSIFKADSNGIYLGNATFASAPFRVNMSGALTSSSGAIGDWAITAGYLKSASGDIELKGTTTSHIKAINPLDSTDYVQMTAASNVPRFDIFLNGIMRVSMRNSYLMFYSDNETEIGWLSGALIGAKKVLGVATDQFNVLQFDGSGAAKVATSGLILAEENSDTVDGHFYLDGSHNLEIASYRGPIEMFPSADSGTKEVRVAGSITPIADNTYDLGNTNYRWEHVYCRQVDSELDILGKANLQLTKAGAIVAIKDVGGTTRYLTCVEDPDNAGHYILYV